MPPTRTESVDALANSKRDYQQHREELSLRYYGCQFKQLARTKRQKVSAWVKNRRGRELARKEHYQMPLRDVLIDYHERTYYEDETSTNRRVDLKRAFDRLRKSYGELICEAAAGIISKSEAAHLLERRKADVCLEVDKANAEAVELLRDYAPCLPADLQRKYQR
jgi:hypothetical protein